MNEEGNQEVPISRDDDGEHQEEVQSIIPSTIIKMMESCRTAWQSLKPKIDQVIYVSNDKEQKKRWSNYSSKALFFGITLFSVYQNQLSSSSAFTLRYRLFLVCIIGSVIVDAALMVLLPDWGNVLVCASFVLLEAAACLMSLSNEHSAFAILSVLSLILAVALLQPKLHEVLPSSTSGSDANQDTNDEENEYLAHLFDLAQGIANCGGLISAISEHYIEGPVNAVGFFFFCSTILGLYLMMVITVRGVGRPHVTCLAIVLMVLLLITLVLIPFAGHSGRNPQVVKYSHHRKILNML